MEEDEEISTLLKAANQVMPCAELQSVASFDTLKKIFSKPVSVRRVRRGGRRKKVNINVSVQGNGTQSLGTVVETVDEDNVEEFSGKNRRGVSESNVWARKVCRDRRKTAYEYEEASKTYKDLEPKMYQIGRCYDRILKSLKTPLVLKIDRDESEDFSYCHRNEDDVSNETPPSETMATTCFATSANTSAEFTFSALS